MSQILINDYLKQLDIIKKVSGSRQDLIFLAEYPLKTATKSNINVDGALLHELRMPLGYWEAKDAADDLDEEIGKKFRRGYRFCDYKEKVVDLLQRVTTVSVETMRITEAMAKASR